MESLKLKLLGDVLVRNNGETFKLDEVRGEGTVLGLYFSAHWCPPCRAFTSELKNFYENFKKSSRLQSFEVILVSSDENADNFKRYFAEMPWFALPYDEDRSRTKQLSKLLRVKSIPTLILVDAVTGLVLSRNGRNHVTDDPNADEFPWKQRTLEAVLRDGNYTNADGRNNDWENISGCIKGLYFSANWCPPCKAFTPQLVATYKNLRRKGFKFEVVFVSSDRSFESFHLYLKTMPWLAVPFDEEKRRKELAELLGVQGIPTLVILDENNEVLTSDGRFEVVEDPNGDHFPWKPNLVEELTAKFSSRLNDDPFVILFTDGNEKELEQAKTLLLPIAKEFESTVQQRPLRFFVGGENEICDSLRDFAKLEDEVPLLVILDTVNQEKYVFEDDIELDSDVVRRFVHKYLNGELESLSFRQ